MGASPELFREVDGSRIAAVSVFLPKPGDRPGRAPQSQSIVALWRVALAVDGQSCSIQRRDTYLLPVQMTNDLFN
jgi:hypothetical protein